MGDLRADPAHRALSLGGRCLLPGQVPVADGRTDVADQGAAPRPAATGAAFLDAAIISTGFAVVGGVFVIAPAAASGGRDGPQPDRRGAYPVGDLLLLAALIRLFTSGAARSLSFWSLVGGLAVTMAVDIQYVLSVVSGVWFPLWINIGWSVGYLLIGFSALHPSVDHLSEPTPERPERVTAARLVALGLALTRTAHRTPGTSRGGRGEPVHPGLRRDHRHGPRSRRECPGCCGRCRHRRSSSRHWHVTTD